MVAVPKFSLLSTFCGEGGFQKLHTLFHYRPYPLQTSVPRNILEKKNMPASSNGVTNPTLLFLFNTIFGNFLKAYHLVRNIIPIIINLIYELYESWKGIQIQLNTSNNYGHLHQAIGRTC